MEASVERPFSVLRLILSPKSELNRALSITPFFGRYEKLQLNSYGRTIRPRGRGGIQYFNCNRMGHIAKDRRASRQQQQRLGRFQRRGRARHRIGAVSY